MTHPGRNDPCPCGSGKKYKHCHLGKSDDAWSAHGLRVLSPPPDSSSPFVVALPPTYDSDLVDDEVDAITGEMTPLDEAWELVEEAWADPSPKRRKKLAKQALKLSADCAGAYYLLGQLENSDRKRIELFDRAIDTASRVLEPATLEDLASGDWERPEVEYAMYAMQYRALTYVTAGEPERAIDAFDAMLELDSFDRLRSRAQLIVLLLDLGRDEEAEELALEDMDEQTDPISFFARALIIFRREGDTIFARRALAEAIMTFPDLVDLLAGPPPAETVEAGGELPNAEEVEERVEELFDDALWDEEDELNPLGPVAEAYVVLAHAVLWHRTEGARDWINAVRAAGPGVRYQTDLLGDGPALMLTGSKGDDFRRCPECHGRTVHHPLDLVLMLESHQLLDVQLNARRCPACDVVSVDLNDIYRKAASTGPQDFVPYGYIRADAGQSRPPDPAGQEWLREHARPWRRIADEDSKRTAWPTLESQREEIEQIIKESGLDSLLGPITDILRDQPGRPLL